MMNSSVAATVASHANTAIPQISQLLSFRECCIDSVCVMPFNRVMPVT